MTSPSSESTPSSIFEEFSAYRAKWPARSPDLSRQMFDDELELLTDGLSELPPAPASDVIWGTPPTSWPDDAAMKTKYLWVVSLDNIPYILENGEIGARLGRGSVSHTNLTGGKDAHCGGELWFRNHNTFWLCGGSSRYKARSGEELADIAASFEKVGYEVINMGWDEGSNSAIRLFRG